LQESAPEKLPALVLKLAIAGDGGLLLDGVPAPDEGVRQLFAQLARRSERVEIRFQVDANTRTDPMEEKVNGIVRWAREARLAMSFHVERTGTAQVQR
jgi:hypothetical protein